MYVSDPAGQKFNLFWRDARVVERGGLENRCTCKGTQGSNPCLSALTSVALAKEVLATLASTFVYNFGG